MLSRLKQINWILIFSLTILSMIQILLMCDPTVKYEILPSYSEYMQQSEKYNEFRRLQNRRRQKVKDVCRRYNITNGKLGEGGYNFLVDDNGKFVFCNNYKVASSNWRRALSYVNAHRTEQEIEQFIIADGKSMDKTPGRVFHRHAGYLTKTTYITDLPAVNRTGILNNTFKFTCVRNPFERLLSAWRDKVALGDPDNGYFFYDLPRDINKALISENSTAGQDDEVTFEKFLWYILYQKKHNNYDIHWRPLYLHCQFCLIDYDVIVHMETISNEAPFVLQKFAGKGDVSTKAVTVFPPPEFGPSFKQWKDQTKTATLVEKYYKMVSRMIRDQIRQMYALDFELFGYDNYLPFERNETNSAT